MSACKWGCIVQIGVNVQIWKPKMLESLLWKFGYRLALLLIALAVLEVVGAGAQSQTETWRFALTRMTDGYTTRFIDVGELTCIRDSAVEQNREVPVCTFEVTDSTQNSFYAHSPAFSQIDNRLAYIGEAGNLHSLDPIDLQPVPIAQDEILAGEPAWSSDGQWILYESSSDQSFVIRAVRSDGSFDQVVSPLGIAAGSPTWSSSGDEYAYITFTFDESQLVLSRLGEPSVTRALSEVTNPVRVRWSPVDDRLAVLVRNENTYELELVIVNSDGSGYRNIPTTLSEISDMEWAPDGSAVFYSFGNFLFRIKLETGVVELAYANLDNLNNYHSDGTFALASPSVPASDRIVFEMPPGYPEATAPDEIFTMNTDGSNWCS